MHVLSMSRMACLGLFAAAAGFSASPPTDLWLPPVGRTRIFPATRSRPNKYVPPLVAVRMASQGENLPEEETATPDTDEAGATGVVSAKGSSANAANEAPKGGGFSLMLLPTLLVKLSIVMGIKIATDVVVFPLLWLYRLVRLAKRKVFGKRNFISEKVNGTTGQLSDETS